MPHRLSRASVVRVFRPRSSVSSTGQSSHILIRCSTRRSTIRRATDLRRSEWGMLPKETAADYPSPRYSGGRDGQARAPCFRRSDAGRNRRSQAARRLLPPGHFARRQPLADSSGMDGLGAGANGTASIGRRRRPCRQCRRSRRFASTARTHRRSLRRTPRIGVAQGEPPCN